MIDPSYLKQKKELSFTPYSDGAILFHQHTRQIWPLNHSAAATWCFLEDTDNFTKLLEILSNHFHISQEKLQFDIERLLIEFADQGLTGNRPFAGTTSIHPATAKINFYGHKISPPRSWNTSQCFETPEHLLEINTVDCPAIKPYTSALKHLKTSKNNHRPNTTIWIIPAESGGNGWDVFYNQRCCNQDVSAEHIPPLLAFLTFNCTSNALHSHLLFHAAVLAKDTKAYLFPAHVGFGKSTLSMFLCKNDFLFLSDELALVHPKTLTVRPMPLPLCIKSGSLEVLTPQYPQLNKLPSFFRGDGKEVRYMAPPQNAIADLHNDYPIAALIFPHFTHNTAAKMNLISKSEAIRNLAHTGSSDRPLNNKDINALIRLVDKNPCYSLKYADLGEALQLLKSFI